MKSSCVLLDFKNLFWIKQRWFWTFFGRLTKNLDHDSSILFECLDFLKIWNWATKNLWRRLEINPEKLPIAWPGTKFSIHWLILVTVIFDFVTFSENFVLTFSDLRCVGTWHGIRVFKTMFLCLKYGSLFLELVSRRIWHWKKWSRS